MSERDKRNLSDVHRSEPDPFRDRQNLEPTPVDDDLDEGPSDADLEMTDLDDDIDFDDDDDLDDEEELDDDDVVSARSRSDIGEFTEEDSDDDPSEDESPRNHDDDDPWGDGIHDTPMAKRYEDMADRDELARRLEDLVADAYDWLGRSQDEDAREIYDTLLNVSERLGNPSEETTRTEPGEPPPDRDETDP